MTSTPLNEIKHLLDELEREIDKVKRIWDDLRELNPDFEQLSEEHWKEKQTLSWLHGATTVQEANELEQWLFDFPPLTATAQSSACEHYGCWRKNLEKEGNWENAWGAYYADFSQFDIVPPEKEESLIAYVERLAIMTREQGKGHHLEWRALKSFVDFLRKEHPENEIAFIEHIFPKKMNLFHGQIIRKVAPEVFAIPSEIASAILIELASQVRYGRPNAQLTAAESLGLCWICLTASRLRLPIHLKSLHLLKTTALNVEGNSPCLFIPTFFGDRKIQISNHVDSYLQVLSQIPSIKPRQTILQRPLRTLTACFTSTIKKLLIPSNFGNITFVSLITPPNHDVGLYRYQPK